MLMMLCTKSRGRRIRVLDVLIERCDIKGFVKLVSDAGCCGGLQMTHNQNPKTMREHI